MNMHHPERGKMGPGLSSRSSGDGGERCSSLLDEKVRRTFSNLERRREAEAERAEFFCLRRADAYHCAEGGIFRTQGPVTTLAHRSPHALTGELNQRSSCMFEVPIKAG